MLKSVTYTIITLMFEREGVDNFTMENKETTEKKFRRRKNDYGYLSIVIDKELKEKFEVYLNNHSNSITQFLTECIKLAVDTDKDPRELYSDTNSESINIPQAVAEQIETTGKKVDECKDNIKSLEGRIDLLIKYISK